MAGGLTRKQQTMLSFIAKYIGENGYPPSFEEIRVGVGLKSKGNVHNYMARLKERGYVAYRPFIARSLMVLKLPSESQDALLAAIPDDALVRELERRHSLREAA